MGTSADSADFPSAISFSVCVRMAAFSLQLPMPYCSSVLATRAICDRQFAFHLSLRHSPTWPYHLLRHHGNVHAVFAHIRATLWQHWRAGSFSLAVLLFGHSIASQRNCGTVKTLTIINLLSMQRGIGNRTAPIYRWRAVLHLVRSVDVAPFQFPFTCACARQAPASNQMNCTHWPGLAKPARDNVNTNEEQ